MARLRTNAHYDDAATPAIAPLRFDAPSDVAYHPPRDGFWRTFRVPLLVALACGALGAAVWLAWTPALQGIADAAAALAAREGDGRTQLTASIALGALALLAFLAAWGRATHPRRAVRLSGDRGRMAVDAIAGGLRQSFLGLHAVRDAEVTVTNRGRGRVLVRAVVRVDPDARIDDTLDGVDDLAAWLVQDRLGLILHDPPMVDVRYDELDLRAGRARLHDGDA